jgi:hypothetical protein
VQIAVTLPGPEYLASLMTTTFQILGDNLGNDALFWRVNFTYTASKLNYPSTTSVWGGAAAGSQLGLMTTSVSRDGVVGSATDAVGVGDVAGMAQLNSGNLLFFADKLSKSIRQWNRTSGVVSTVLKLDTFDVNSMPDKQPRWMVADSARGRLYIGDNHCSIWYTDRQGDASSWSPAVLLAGTGFCGGNFRRLRRRLLAGVFQFSDPNWSNATLSRSGNLIAVMTSDKLELISTVDGTVTELVQLPSLTTCTIARPLAFSTTDDGLLLFLCGGRLYRWRTDNQTMTPIAVAGVDGSFAHRDGANGVGTFASEMPYGLVVGPLGQFVYIGDGCAIRRVTLATGAMDTVTGALHDGALDKYDSSTYMQCGIFNGAKGTAWLSRPSSLLIDARTNASILFTDWSVPQIARPTLRSVNLATGFVSAAMNQAASPNVCTLPEAIIEGAGTSWSSNNITSLRFLPAITTTGTATRSSMMLMTETTSNGRRQFSRVDMITGQKTRWNELFPASFLASTAGDLSVPFVGAAVIGNQDTFFFWNRSELVSFTRTGSAIDAAGVLRGVGTVARMSLPLDGWDTYYPYPTVRQVEYNAARDSLIWYEQSTDPVSWSNQGCMFRNISWTDFKANRTQNLFTLASDPLCMGSGGKAMQAGTSTPVSTLSASSSSSSRPSPSHRAMNTLALTQGGGVMLNEAVFTLHASAQVIYSATQRSGDSRLLRLDLNTLQVTNLFVTRWDTLGEQFTLDPKGSDPGDFFFADGLESQYAMLGSVSSMVVSESSNTLYLTDSAGPIFDSPILEENMAREFVVVRKVDLTSLRIDTIHGGEPWTTQTDVCADREARSQRYRRDAFLALDTRTSNGQLFVSQQNKIRSVVVGAGPIVTRITPSTGTLGAANTVITLQGLQFGSNAASLVSVTMGTSTPFVALGSPVWDSSTQIRVTIPAATSFGTYSFAITTTASGGVAGPSSAGVTFTLPARGTIRTVSPTQGPPGTSVTVNSTSWGAVSNVGFFVNASTTLRSCASFTQTSDVLLVCTLPLDIAPFSVLTFQAYVSPGNAPSQINTASNGLNRFTVFVPTVETPIFDTNVSSTNVKPASSATTVVTEQGDVINITANVNPCNSRAMNPCRNGGVCSYTPFANVSNAQGGFDVTYASLSCACPGNCHGPYCTLVLMECLNCVTTVAGGSVFTLVGLGFDVVTGVRIAGVVLPFSRGNISVASNARLQTILQQPWPNEVRAMAELEFIRFIAPTIVSNSTELEVSRSTGGGGTSDSALQLQTLLSALVPHSQFDSSTRRHLLQSTNGADSTALTTGTSNGAGVRVSSDLAVEFPSGFKFAYSLNSMVLYSVDPCIQEGQWKQNPSTGGCISCPGGQQRRQAHRRTHACLAGWVTDLAL